METVTRFINSNGIWGTILTVQIRYVLHMRTRDDSSTFQHDAVILEGFDHIL